MNFNANIQTCCRRYFSEIKRLNATKYKEPTKFKLGSSQKVICIY